MTELLASAAVILVDQCSKQLALARLSNGGSGVRPLLSIRPSLHTRAFYRHSGARALLLILFLAALACAIVLSAGALWFQGEVSRIGLGLAFGGAAGNLLDIARRSAIVDFLDMGGVAVCNLADAAIVAGLSMALASRV